MRHRCAVAWLASFSALAAIAGGLALLGPRGELSPPLELLAHTPFDGFLVPGLILAFVVGGTSLASAILAWRRSPAAVDATVLAGGTLLVWIAAESALFRMFVGLQAAFGLLGAVMLALGVDAGWRSGAPRHRWIIAVTAGETLGYLVPASAGVLSTHAAWSEGAQVGLLAAAGLGEGAWLGAAQALGFPFAVRRARYVALTAAAAALVWMSVMSLRVVLGTGAPLPAKVVIAALAAAIGLGAIGGAQWWELRRDAERAARRWIAWTALGWTIALPLSFAPSPFVDERTPLAPSLVLWACGGALMAHAFAWLTWPGVRALSRDRERSAAPPSR